LCREGGAKTLGEIDYDVENRKQDESNTMEIGNKPWEKARFWDTHLSVWWGNENPVDGGGTPNTVRWNKGGRERLATSPDHEDGHPYPQGRPVGGMQEKGVLQEWLVRSVREKRETPDPK